MKPASIVAVAALIWCMTGIAPGHSHAFQWKVRMADNVPYASCTINMSAGPLPQAGHTAQGRKQRLRIPEQQPTR